MAPVEIAIPFRLAPDGSIAVEKLPTRQVYQHIRSLIATNRTERVMVVGYGCDLVDQLFEPSDDTVEAEVARQVSAGLARWEPSIAGSQVRAVRNISGDGIANVEVLYARNQGTAVSAAASTSQVNRATVKVGGQVLESVHG